jgi:hypothetical protein
MFRHLLYHSLGKAPKMGEEPKPHCRQGYEIPKAELAGHGKNKERKIFPDK